MQNNIQYSFERLEKKYFITPYQYEILISKMQPFIKADAFKKYTVCSIYYDTPDFSLIRASIQKPAYKEKLRVRSYGTPAADGRVFIELKKKHCGVVYKRRIATAASCADSVLYGPPRANASQIEKEIKWFRNFYRPEPKVFIACGRTAFSGIENPDLRITFDMDMRWRTDDLDLRCGDYGNPLNSDDKILMEIKFSGAAPVWLCRLLSENGIFPVSFSKYGACYCRHIMQEAAGCAGKNKKEVLLSA